MLQVFHTLQHCYQFETNNNLYLFLIKNWSILPYLYATKVDRKPRYIFLKRYYYGIEKVYWSLNLWRKYLHCLHFQCWAWAWESKELRILKWPFRSFITVNRTHYILIPLRAFRKIKNTVNLIQRGMGRDYRIVWWFLYRFKRKDITHIKVYAISMKYVKLRPINIYVSNTKWKYKGCCL